MRVILYRRAMMRIAERLAEERGATALITGDSLGQVASQTIENIRTVNAVVKDIEVFRPLIGMDKQEIIDQATAIGTYEISTRPHQDCCVLFEAREPATRANVGLAEKAESELDIDALTARALEGVETLEFELPDP
jgi:thiamine biosynthesis protein ThiI